MGTLDQLIAAGKVRYAGVSNYPGWQVMKAQAVADRNGWPRLVAHQVYYSLIGRAYEADLMPLGRRPGRRRAGVEPARLGSPDRQDRARPADPRGQPAARDRTVRAAGRAQEHLYRVIDALEAVAAETGKTVPQVAINWLLRRPTVVVRDHRRAQRGSSCATISARSAGR